MATETQKQKDKGKLIEQILKNSLYLPESGLYIDLRRRLEVWPLSALAALNLIIENK